MRFAEILFVVMMTLACSHDEDEVSAYQPSPAVAVARDEALARLPPGWPSGLDCDGLLWSGLARAAGANVDLLAARTSEGVWWRRQVVDGNCYPDGSQSSISRDMFVGLLAGLVEAGDTQTVRETIDYARAHGGKMGEGAAARIFWTQNIYGIYERAIGVNSTAVVLFPVAEDYENHLQLIKLATYRRAAGGLPIHLRKRAGELANAFPGDALAQAVYCYIEGDLCEEAERLVLDPVYQAPSYVRGPDSAADIHRAYAARILLYRAAQ